jgi:hypothetical protein
MRYLSRDEHCALAGIEIEAFKSLQRRQLLPGVPEAHKAYQGYTPLETLGLIIAEEFVTRHAMARERAANMVSGSYAIWPHWPRVALTSKQLCDGATPKAQIVFGWMDLPKGASEEPEPVCGTFAEIAKAYPSPIGFIGISVSRAAAVLRMRANRQHIDLEDLWAMKQRPTKPSINRR